MANIFNRQANNAPQLSPRAALEGKYNSARYNLLGVIAFTAINLILLIANTGSYFLFSAYLPYFFVDMGMYLCNKYPAEYYDEFFQPLETPFPDGVFYAMIVIAVVILLAYLLCFIFSSKKRVGWLIAALVFFGIDTAAYLLLFGIDLTAILDILFHAWVIYYLVSGIIAHNKLKNLPEDAPIEAADFTVSETVTEEATPIEEAAEAAEVQK